MPRAPKSAQGKSRTPKAQGGGVAGENPRKRKLSHADAPTPHEKKQRTKDVLDGTVAAGHAHGKAKQAIVKRAIKAGDKVLREPKTSSNVLASATKSNKAPKTTKKEGKEAVEAPRDELLDKEQVRKAVRALYVHVERQAKKEKKALFEPEETLYLTVALTKVPAKRPIKPRKIPLPFPLNGDECEICLIVKDSEKGIKQKIQDKGVPNVKKVITVSKLRDNYAQYESQRKLLHSFDLFLCDDRVNLLMPGLLGKSFIKSKRLPIPIKISASNLSEQVAKARDATFYYIPTGTTSSIRVGISNQKQEEVVANTLTVSRALASFLPQGWSSIRSLHMKTADSISLPLYSRIPDAKPTKAKRTDKEANTPAEAVVSEPKKGNSTKASK